MPFFFPGDVVKNLSFPIFNGPFYSVAGLHETSYIRRGGSYRRSERQTRFPTGYRFLVFSFYQKMSLPFIARFLYRFIKWLFLYRRQFDMRGYRTRGGLSLLVYESASRTAVHRRLFHYFGVGRWCSPFPEPMVHFFPWTVRRCTNRFRSSSNILTFCSAIFNLPNPHLFFFVLPFLHLLLVHFSWFFLTVHG